MTFHRICSALTDVQVSIPLVDGKLMLGTWQGIYLFEHRRASHRRRCRCTYSAIDLGNRRKSAATPASVLGRRELQHPG
jgi:Uncharacterised protein family UPF0047